MNAIILCAGFGSRMAPLTITTPKPLIKIKNKPIVERQIEMLLEAGIKEIYIVVGYLKESFNYLKTKYKVKLIENPTYDSANNISSLWFAMDKLNNTFIIEGDVFIKHNIFKVHPTESTLFANFYKGKSGEWGISVEKNRIKKIDKFCDNQFFLSGVSYWTKDDCNKIKQSLLTHYPNNKQAFWEEFGYMNKIENFKIKLKPLKTGWVQEVDTIEDLSKQDSIYSNLLALSSLNLDYINKIELKGGLTNKSYLLKDGKIIRIENPERENFIDRKKESKAIMMFSKLNISEDVLFFDPNTGIKISKKIEGTILSDAIVKSKIDHVAILLKKLHSSKLKQVKYFDLFFLLNQYFEKNNKLIKDKSYYIIFQSIKNYAATHNYESQKQLHLCHRDLVPSNFILDSKNSLKLLDLEYADFFEPEFDIASLFDESDFNREEEIEFMKHYGKVDYNKVVFYKVYLNLLWSIWCYFFYEDNFQHLNDYRIFRLKKAKYNLTLLDI